MFATSFIFDRTALLKIFKWIKWVKGLENKCFQKLGFVFGKKRKKLCNTAEKEQLQLPSKIKVTRHYLLYMKKNCLRKQKA